MRTPKSLPYWEMVKKICRARKISQKRLAGLIGIKYDTLTHWMCYGFFPDVLTALHIAEALEVSAEYLIKGEDKKTGEAAAERP